MRWHPGRRFWELLHQVPLPDHQVASQHLYL